MANAMGYTTMKPGMKGPKAERVEQALELFDLDEIPEQGCVDYLLGAEPGGGVYVIGRCDSEFQAPYLKYYKLRKADESEYGGNYYLFYRPYHLCHLETPKAIFQAVERGETLLEGRARITEVYAYAKADFPAGTLIEEAIGSDVVYGMIRNVEESKGMVPQVLLECEGEKPFLKRNVKKDEVLMLGDVEWPDKKMFYQYYMEDNQPG